MEFARRSFAQVKAFLSGLSADTRYLLVCLVVIAAGVIFFAAIYAGSGSYTPIAVPADRQAQATAQFDGAGIRYKVENGTLQVSQKDQPRAFAILAERSLLGPNIGGAFQAMLQNQGPWHSNEQNRQALMVAKQDWLSAVISEMTDVKTAHVILDVPKRRGFGDNVMYGSASVSVVMQPTTRINKDHVEAIAGLVSGAVARIRLQDVSVVDASGKRYTVDTDDMAMPGKTFEVVQAQERHFQRKIERALSYIP